MRRIVLLSLLVAAPVALQKLTFFVQTFVATSGAEKTHWLESVDEGDGFIDTLPDSSTITGEVFRTSESLRLYGDPGSSVFFNATRNSAVGRGHATITISGYFTDDVTP